MTLLADPNPDWPRRAAREAAIWQDALGLDLIACHHIGSTSVAGLMAKPIIDLMPEVRSLAAAQAATAKLVAAGYEAMGAFGLEGRLYFRKSDTGGTRTHHAHVYATGDPSIRRHLAFRDMLRADATIRDAYGALKQRAATDCAGDMNTYMDIKDPWIKTHEAIALATFAPKLERP